MNSKSLLVLSLASLAQAEGGMLWGPCPADPPSFAASAQNFNIQSLEGTWYEIERPSGFPMEKGLDCVTARFTWRPDALIYKLGINFGSVKTETGELKNGYVLGEPGRDWTWMHARGEADGTMYMQAMMMPEGKLQVLKTDDFANYVVLGTCYNHMMGIQHASGYWVFAKNRTLPQGTINEIRSFIG